MEQNGSKWKEAGLLALPICVYILLVNKLWFMTDDAFITFRYARNWADGLGLRFNPGENPPVEGFSNFLWTAVMAGLRLLGQDMVRLAPWISLSLGLILLIRLDRFLKRVLHLDRAPRIAGLLCLALSPCFAAWTTGGLETVLFTFLVFEAFMNRAAHPARAGLCAGLAALTRPEGIVWALVLLLILPGKGVSHRRNKAVYLGCVLLLFIPYFAARWYYFGDPLPNTFYAKSTESASTLIRGFNYTATFYLTFLTPLLVLAASPLLFLKEAPYEARASALVCYGFTAFSIASGGDFMAMGRFMAPAMPFFAAMAATLSRGLRFSLRRRADPALLALAAGALSLQILPVFGLDLMPDSLRRALHFRFNAEEPRSELAQWEYMKQNLQNWTLLGKALKMHSKTGDSVVAAAIGALGYYSDLEILDQCGLVDSAVARREGDPSRPHSPGHDRFVEPEFFLDRCPTFLRAQIVPLRYVGEAEENFRQSLPLGYAVLSFPLTPKDRQNAVAPVLVCQKRVK